MLTLAVQSEHDCAVLIHHLLPSWVTWRYIFFKSGDIAALNITTPTLVMVCSIHPAVAAWAKTQPFPVGIMQNSDELGVQDVNVYGSFAYAIRYYYFKQFSSNPSIPIRALGNITCGQNTTFPPSFLQSGEPPLGVYWMTLLGRGLGNVQSGHTIGSHWPSSQRLIPVAWIGSLRSDRQDMVRVMKAEFPDGDIQIEGDFGGNVGPMEYGHVRLARAVFCLVPYGNNPETHRLTEVIDQGCIPVFLDAEFHHQFFEAIPGISAQNWSHAASEMKILLQGNPATLDQLQEKVIRWWFQLRSCITSDLEAIFRSAQSLYARVP